MQPRIVPPTFRPLNEVERGAYDWDVSGVLHIFHSHWWGIRSATELLPGWKMGIEPEGPFDSAPVISFIKENDIQRVVFQGYSNNAQELAEHISASCRNVRSYAVSHVSAAQFDNQFEIEMLDVMVRQKRRGVITDLLSVKPNFNSVCPDFSEHLIINSAPQPFLQPDKVKHSALIPLTRGLRKNMQVNHLAMLATSCQAIFSTLTSGDFRTLADDSRVTYLGHIPNKYVMEIMRHVSLVSAVTLIECQPMVANEAIAVGTPCLTGPLNLPFCADHELRRLTEIPEPDNIRLVASRAETLMEMWDHQRKYLSDLCEDYHREVVRLSNESYGTIFG
ncbi:hypothetical protein [Methylobacterium sp. JK268]